jgi:hypothetical protein
MNRDKLTMTEELITPQMALYYLSFNFENNRSLSNANVNNLALAMRLGKWELGEAIKFDKNGILRDGQHRLQAVVESNTPVKFIVIRGYEPSVSMILDRGKTRNLKDLSTIKEYNLTTEQISTFNALLSFTGHPKIKVNIIEKMFLPEERLELNLKYLDGIKFSRTHSQGPNKIKSTVVSAITTKAYYAGIDKNLLDDFLLCFHGYIDKVKTTNKIGIIQKLINKFHKHDWKANNNGISFRYLQYVYTQSALLNFLNNKNPSCFYPCDDNLFPISAIEEFVNKRKQNK